MDGEYPAYSVRGKCPSGVLGQTGRTSRERCNCSNALFTIETRLGGFLKTLCGVFFSLSSGVFISCMMMKNPQEKAVRPVRNKENPFLKYFQSNFPEGPGSDSLKATYSLK
jgi:hypothetical protein